MATPISPVSAGTLDVVRHELANASDDASSLTTSWGRCRPERGPAAPTRSRSCPSSWSYALRCRPSSSSDRSAGAGAPATLLGLMLLAYWLWHRLRRTEPMKGAVVNVVVRSCS